MYGIIAIKLRQRISQSYRLVLFLEGFAKENINDSTISYKRMIEFCKTAKRCSTWSEFDALEKEFLRYIHVY